METLWKRLLSGVMAIVVMLSLLPVTALASLLNNDPAVNREILDQLEQICGSPEEAERYYGLLCQYGLLNEEGAIPESWSVTMDGQDITLDELRKMLSGDYDPEKLVLVDGTPVTLENLETILAIEDYIAYLRSTYFNGCQWSEEETGYEETPYVGFYVELLSKSQYFIYRFTKAARKPTLRLLRAREQSRSSANTPAQEASPQSPPRKGSLSP